MAEIKKKPVKIVETVPVSYTHLTLRFVLIVKQEEQLITVITQM